jgi:3-aminobutyryl-CoA ammonia-lyase
MVGTVAQAMSGNREWTEDVLLRVRLAPADGRYANGLVAGSKAMELFADLETELALREGGDEGLCARYHDVEFLAPLHVGDFVEARARIVERGNRSRRVEAELYKVLGSDEHGHAITYPKPVLAVRATATIVVGRMGVNEATADIGSPHSTPAIQT